MFSAILGGLSAGFKLFSGLSQRSAANKIKVPEVKYNPSPYARDTLNIAKNLYGGRMPGAANAEANILSNNAATGAAIGRNANDSSQALALLTAARGNTDQALAGLANQDSMFKLNAANLVASANQGMTGELDKVYNDSVRARNEAIKAKSDLNQSYLTNVGNAFKEATLLGDSYDRARQETEKLNIQAEDSFKAANPNVDLNTDEGKTAFENYEKEYIRRKRLGL